jgi:DNA-binding MarR family transcriptional regulator
VLVEQGPLRMSDLANELEIVPRSATTRVDQLETAGLAARRDVPGDRRAILVEATDTGRALVSRLADERRAAAESLFSPLTPDERSHLARLLATVVGPAAPIIAPTGAPTDPVTGASGAGVTP